MNTDNRTLNTSTVRALLNVRVTMRDGVSLATHVYLPESGGPFPVLFTRTPYEALGKGTDILEWPGRGYAYVRQDVRGRFWSKGEWYPWRHEQDDAEDTLNWLVAQPWCNGNVGMYGGSYVSATQLAASMSGHPALKCFTPCLIGSEFYHTSYSGGAFRLAWQTCWSIEPKIVSDQNVIRNHLPLQDIDLFARGQEVPYWRDALAHPHRDNFWKPFSMGEQIGKVKAPAFIRTGWFDLFVGDVFDLFNGLRKHADENVRKNTRMIIGPWPHNINQRVVGEVDFGESAAVENLTEQEVAFIEQFTNAKPAAAAAPLRLFIMGANQWRDEHEWPLARTVWTDWFLSSGGNANTSDGDGKLGENPSGPCDYFDYDPAMPIPTKGGAWDFSIYGPCDQSETEKLAGVLVYTSDLLAEGLEVTGPVEVCLFAASSAPDTDFTAKLVDVCPDGKALSITDGIVRARYRNGSEELLVPGQITEFRIRCNPTAYLFKPGHRLRMEISSSNFPAFSRNLNTGNDPATDTEMRVAHQTIFHTGEYPSRMILPVIKTPTCRIA